MSWLERKAPKVHRFLNRHDKPYPLLREALGVVAILVVLIAILFAATGQPLTGGYPVVVVTSGSMMHCSNANLDGTGPPLGRDCEPTRYGRIGFIDPGDLVFVRDVDSHTDIATRAQGEDEHYGKAGDVLVYRPYGSTAATPIIHRALFWLQVNGDGTFTVAELGLQNVKTLDQPALVALTRCNLPTSFNNKAMVPADSGFVTRGDNNPGADQCGFGLSPPARMEWVLGKGRGEVPWLGLIKLLVDDTTGRTNGNYAAAGADSKVLLWITVGALVVVPWGVDIVMRRRRQANSKSQPAAGKTTETGEVGAGSGNGDAPAAPAASTTKGAGDIPGDDSSPRR